MRSRTWSSHVLAEEVRELSRGGARPVPGLQLGIPALGPARSAARLTELVELYAQGGLTLHIRKAYSLDRAADAHRDVETGHGRGKVVLTLDGRDRPGSR